jgi:hypothetical protein
MAAFNPDAYLANKPAPPPAFDPDAYLAQKTGGFDPDAYLAGQQKPAEETTSNPFAGMIGQAASLTGAGIEAVAEVAERVGDKLELAVPLSGISEEDIKSKKQLQPLFDWAKSLKGFDESIGYQPSTQLKDLGTNPLNAVPFIAERVITSAPDMVAAVAVLPAYVMARTKQILDERVKNDNKTLDDATVGDVTAAATAAVIESTLERFATKGLLKPTTAKTGTGRIAKETGIQAGTEVVEEEAAYLGEAAGTAKGLSAEEALTRGAEAAIVGGGLGATVQGAKEVFAPQAETQTPPPPPAGSAVQQAAATPAPEIPGVDPARVEQLTQTFIEQGLDPGRAQYRAVEIATREAEDQADEQVEDQTGEQVGEQTPAPTPAEAAVETPAATEAPTPYIPPVNTWTDANLTATLELQLAKPEDKQNQPLVQAVQTEIQQRAATQGEPDVEQTIPGTSRASVSMVGQPDTDTTAARTRISEPSGVVSTRPNVAGTVEGETVQPTTVGELNLSSIPYEFRSQAGQGQPVVTNTGQNNIIDYSGRRIALVNINGVQVPFYLSTGSGGKVDVPAGKWYPFFGIGADGWINKTGGKEMAGYYGSEVLRNTAQTLDQTIGDIRNDTNVPKVGAYGAHIDAINTGFTPSENGTNATETTVRSNIDSLLKRLNSAEQVAPQKEAITEPAANQAKSDDVIAEEAEIPNEVADAVGDITTLPIEEEVVETTKGKTGPKGPRLTPEQKAASDERRKQQRTGYKSNVKAVDAAEAALNNTLTDLKPENYGSDVELQEGVESQRIKKIQAIKSLLLLNRALKGTTLGKRVAELLKNPAITKMELENVQKGIAAQVSKAGTQVKVGRADGRFSGMTNGQQALRHIIKTGNAFQRFLAQRLLPFVKDVNFKVIEEDDALPSQITEGGATEDWDASRGLFLRVVSTGERFVFVRGISAGPSNGVNNVTVLHEMLHAALNKKMDLALDALQSGFDRKSDLAVAYNALIKTINLTADRVNEMREAGTLPEFMEDLISANIFGDPREFVAYAMSDPRFQKFLMETAGHLKQSLFTRFINNVRQFFNMDATHTSALSDIANITDTMLTARKTPLMRMKEASEKQSGNLAEVSSAIKAKKQRVNAALVKIQRGDFADAMREIPTLVGLRDQQTFLDVLNSSWVGFTNFKLQQLLPAMQTEALVEWANRLGIKGIKEAWQNLGDMAAMRNSLTTKMVPISDALTKLATKAPEQFQRLASVMHYSTLLYRDPTKPFYLTAGTGTKREHHAFATKAARDAYIQANSAHLQTLGSMKAVEDTDLQGLWNGLTDANKKLYEQARDFYKDNHELYHQLLEDQIANSKLVGTAGNANSPKGKLIAQIKQMYEDGKNLYPYFPLMRYGQYWIRVGKGVGREFYMFENAFDRNMFLRQRFRQLQAAGETRSLKEMLEAETIDMGNDLSNARKKMEADASGLVKEMFKAIDDGAKNNNLDAKAIEDLKDQIYQMYLQTLPDRNFRRQFMHRQGTTGFTGDVARNFVETGTNMANQLARIKFGPKIMGEIERAQDSLKGNPDKAKLGEFVTEMRMRAEQQVRPESEDSFAFGASNFLNQSAYLWLMTSVKTAAAQMTAMPIFVGPVLTSNHGFNPFRVAASLSKSLAIFGTTGIKRTADDGTVSYEFPSMANNQLVKLSGDEKLAAQYMLDRGISESTQANDLMNRKSISTKQSTSVASRTYRATATVMTGLFHHAERMVREVTFMTSYRLYREDTNPDTKKKYTHEEALRAAEAETKEALGNYHASNRPRGLIANAERQVLINAHKPTGRAILQFKMFPAFVTTFFMRNAYRMFAGLDAKDRAKAMTQFVGTLTMSTALAGYVGIPGATMAMGAIQGAMNVYRDLFGDEDEDDPLEKRNLELWFRNVWLPQTFGNVKIGDATLDEVLDRGLIATMTGYDISSSLSMNNMWFPEVKESATAAAEMQEYLFSLLGPGASLYFKQIPQAIDYFNKGEVMRGWEQLAPAFARGAFTAARYEKEGALTSTGSAIKEAEEFTEGQLWAQSMGFATTGLVAQREAIFKLQGEILKVRQERTKLLDRLDLEINKGDDEDVEKVLEKIQKFNSRNPFAMIKYENIKQSLDKQAKRRAQADRGMPIDKNYFPQVAPVLESPGKKLERESALNNP